MTVEVLYFDGCPGYEALLPRLRELLHEAGVEDAIELRQVQTPQEAERERFLGSPAVRVDGHDIDPSAAQRSDFGMKCRLYPTREGLRVVPPEEWVREALARRTSSPATKAAQTNGEPNR